MRENSDEFSVPLFDVTGDTHKEIGLNIGRAAGELIRKGQEKRKKWVDKLLRFSNDDPAKRIDPFKKALEKEMPHVLDELVGIAEGAGVPFERIFAMFTNPELSALMKSPTHDDDCTTAAINAGGKLWVGHNEDGSCGYRDLIYLLRISWPSGIKSLCLAYPGYLPGNGPSVNSAGMVQTVNYIGAKAIKPGIPRYAIDRAIMEARNMDEAVAMATRPGRAYSQHHLLISSAEHKMVSVETSPDRHSVMEVKGVFTHANQYVHPKMTSVPEFAIYTGSSFPRQKAAEKWARKIEDPANVDAEKILEVLSGHENYPLSICRHPYPKVSGCTLGAAILEATGREIRVFDKEPCKRLSKSLAWPE